MSTGVSGDQNQNHFNTSGHKNATTRRMSFRQRVVIRTDYVDQHGCCPVVLQVFLHRTRIRLPLEIHIPEKYFDRKNQRVKKAFTGASDFNLLIENALGRSTTIYTDARLAGTLVTKEEFIDRFSNPISKFDFLKFMENEIKSREEKLNPETITVHKTALRRLQSFRSVISFNEITPALMEDFDAYLKKEYNNGVNTRHKILKSIRNYIKRAQQKNYRVQNPFQQFKLKSAKTKKVWLEQQEVQSLMSLYFNEYMPNYLRQTLKKFLFSCFSSLRISDVPRVTADQIVNDTLTFIPKKTSHLDKIVQIPLINYAKQFITETEGNLFPGISNQKTNKYLKTIATMSGIKKNLTTHVARRTYGKLFLKSGGKIEVLQQLYGHSKLEQTMEYVEVDSVWLHQQAHLMDNLKFTLSSR